MILYPQLSLMELPDIGEQCSVLYCKQLDFLPFVCSNCKLMFCKHHFSTSQHDCKSLNEFFKKTNNTENSIKYDCNMIGCSERSPIKLLCTVCDKHFCISHRHHGCLDDVDKSEAKKLKVQQWKKPKEQFQLAKHEADKKVEQTLRNAETNPAKQNLANKVRLMKLKGKALGDNKIPTANRIYFAIQPPIVDDSSNYKPQPLFTSIQWTLGRTIDLFSRRLNIENKNNELDKPKLRLFKFCDGSIVSCKMDVIMGELINFGVITNGDSLILDYIDNERLKSDECFLSNMNSLIKYQSVSI